MKTEMSVIENGNAAIINSRNPKNPDTIIFESGNAYQLYGKRKDNKVKNIGEHRVPDFEHWDDYHFQRDYQYLGIARIVRIKRTLKLELN